MQERDLGQAAIFACTWNMGGVEREQVEAHGETMMRHWIPHGYDIYVRGSGMEWGEGGQQEGSSGLAACVCV